MTLEDTIEYLDKLIEVISDAEEMIGEIVSMREEDCPPASDVVYVLLSNMGCTAEKLLDIREEWLT